jgi:hypothetical protein
VVILFNRSILFGFVILIALAACGGSSNSTAETETSTSTSTSTNDVNPPPFAYVVNTASGSTSIFSIDSDTGALTELGTDRESEIQGLQAKIGQLTRACPMSAASALGMENDFLAKVLGR